MRGTPPPVLLAAALAVLICGSSTGLYRATHREVTEAGPASVENGGARSDDGAPEPTAPAGSAAAAAAAVAVAAADPPPAAPEPAAEASAAPVEPRTADALPADPAPAPDPAPPAPAPAPMIPVGKGMWLYQLSQAGSATIVVEQAQRVGLTHLYLRVGSSKMGFYGQEELNRLLPAAHAAGLKVIGWDFVYLFDPNADAERSAAEIAYVTPDGHRLDAFSADIETAGEGVNLTPDGALAYGARLRELVGPGYPLIATVPRPSPKRPFPFAEATRHFDAIAPMVYWMNRDPAADVAQAIDDLAPLGKPVLAIGQAYDGAPEGGPPGDPPKDALVRFMDSALAKGALGVSFWVWHHATPEQWSAVEEARAWELRPGDPTGRPGVAYLQRLLSHLGQPTTPDGILGPATRASLSAVQASLGVPPTGRLDEPTVNSLLRPRR